MKQDPDIPDFALFGETGVFPDLVHCEEFSARAPVHNWRISAHRHAHMAQLFVVESGRIEAQIEGEKTDVNPLEFLYIPPNMVHQFTFEPESTGLVVSITNAIFETQPIGNDTMTATLANWRVGRLPDYAHSLVNLIVTAWAKDGPFRAQRVMGLTQALLGFVAEAADDAAYPGRQSHPILLRLDALVAERRVANWSPADFAKALSVSTGHLSRICRAATGRGASAYIERKRIQAACRMLAFTQFPISEIGYQLGYGDPSYFSKRFRLVAQSSPTEYRARFASQ
jgi:AraC family transcriptional activator of pobA